MTRDDKLELMAMCQSMGEFIRVWPWRTPQAKTVASDQLLRCVRIIRRLSDTPVMLVPDPAPAPTPVAWRVKDFADGWILYYSEAKARDAAAATGALMQPLYAPGG